MPYIGNIVQDFSVNTAMLNTDSVTSIKIDDGTIVNADINASAAIAGTKIDPSFTSNITITNNEPKLILTDSGDNPDFEVKNQDGTFVIKDTTNNANRLFINTDGHTDIKGNLDCEAGIDVTGNIVGTADLTVNTSTLKVDSANNRVGVGTASPGNPFHAVSTAATIANFQRDSSTSNVAIQFKNDTASMFCGLTSSATGFGIDDDNDLGTGPMFLVQRSNGNVGIGTTSPNSRLNLKLSSRGSADFRITDSDTTNDVLRAGSQADGDGFFQLRTIGGAGNVLLDASGVSYLTGGNVGIGTASPNYELQVNDSSGAVSVIQITNTTTGSGASDGFLVYNNGLNAILSNEEAGDLRLQTSGTSAIVIDSSQNVGIGTTSPDTLLHLSGADTAVIRLENTDTSLGSSQLIGAIEFEKQDPTGAGVGIAGAIRLKSMSSVGQAASMFFATSNSSGNDQDRMTIDFDGRVLIGGATSINASTNADDLQVGASTQSNQTGITLGSTVASSLRFMDAANDSAGYILMNHGTDEMTIKSNSGGIIFNVSGQVATMDSTGLKLASGKGINFHNYGSGTGVTSNLLDDYEEGTWTPDPDDGNNVFSHGQEQGRYIKIGNVVHCTFSINVSLSGTSGFAMFMTGLPFTVKEFSENTNEGISTSKGTGQEAQLEAQQGQTRFKYRSPSSGSAMTVNDVGCINSVTKALRGAITYITT